MSGKIPETKGETTMARGPDPLGALVAGWWVLPVVLAASLGGAVYLTADDDPSVYEASAILAAVPDSSIENEGQRLRSVEILEQRTMVSTLSRIPASGFLRGRAAGVLGTTEEELRRYEVETAVLPSTYLIRVSVRGPDSTMVDSFANALAEGAQATAGRYYRAFGLRVVDRAVPAEGPVEGEERRVYTLAGVLGLLLGVGAAYGVGVIRTVPGVSDDGSR